jgi:hypothetical protein
VVCNVLIAVLEWLAICNCRALTPLRKGDTGVAFAKKFLRFCDESIVALIPFGYLHQGVTFDMSLPHTH